MIKCSLGVTHNVPSATIYRSVGTHCVHKNMLLILIRDNARKNCVHI